MRSLLRQFQATVLGNKPTSKDDAKQRLKLLLIHDQVDLPQARLDAMKDEILEVIARYLEIENAGVEFRLSREDGQIALVSNVPVRRVSARA